MNAYASYNAINSKLHTRKKNLLTREDWNKVLDYTSVAQFTEFLKKRYGYSVHLDNNKPEDIHRGELEMILERYVVDEIEKMLHYFSGPYKDFVKALLLQYDISDLQLILRAIARNESINDFQRHFVHSEAHTKLSYDKLIACQSVAGFVEALKGTVFYEDLKTMTQEDVVTREFHMEMKLYLLYYRLLMKKAEKLSPNDYKVVKQIIGLKIDCLNIQWIYRGMKYYDISREEIMVYSLPGGNISYNGLKKLVYAKSLSEFESLAEKHLKADVFSRRGDILLERNMDNVIYETIHKINDEDSIALALRYIFVLEIETQDLIAVTEGIRYGLDKEEIKKYLVYTL
ncbi:V-type ATPase subunit [Niameybacter massiliensis]|uniref:V-type ATPase subunit n=1 Tax=Holtiella tumoricola TaxID=3018743 RepID=A0AA42DR77_9FIRM|nr:V-type ATPase subunit [Holtiella tumoricola]MDA3733904.1 V-type ATPase subunit [Holtiella tumoricola]